MSAQVCRWKREETWGAVISDSGMYLVLKLCKVDNTRKAYATAFESRNRENIVLLEEVHWLGYDILRMLLTWNIGIASSQTVCQGK